MENSLFRKKSIDRISSPEDLNDYIRVTKPGIWIILAATVVLLLGMCVWGVYGTLNGEVKACMVNSGKNTYCYISEKNVADCTAGMEVHVGSFTGKLTSINKEPDTLDERFPEEMMNIGDYKYGDVVYKATVDITIPVGVYTASVIVESISPLTYVFN